MRAERGGQLDVADSMCESASNAKKYLWKGEDGGFTDVRTGGATGLPQSAE